MRNSTPTIALLRTGGTIQQARTEHGRAPVPICFRRAVPELRAIARVDEVDLCNIDSTEMTHAHRALLRDEVARRIGSGAYDGIVITHGTDSMALTGTYLSLAIPRPGIPVVLTGAQRPLGEPRSDASRNLLTAAEAALGPYQGFGIAFGDELLQANRTVKVSTNAFHAFQTPRAQPWARFGDSVTYRSDLRPRGIPALEDPVPYATGVDVYTVTTDDDPARFLWRASDPGVRGIVIQGVGSGNVPARIADAIPHVTAQGKPVVVVSRCLDGYADATYAVGAQALARGAISGRDLTLDGAVAKLAIGIGIADRRHTAHEDRLAFVRSYLTTPVADEISP